MSRSLDSSLEKASWGWENIFLASFLCLIVANLAVLADPPYWDAITGVFSQAIWLKDHGFNYLELWRQPGWYEGGPNVKILYLLAPFYALLYKFFSPQIVFVISHVLNITCAAVTFTLFFLILKSYMPTLHALVWCVAGAVEPIWSGQCASIYLEMPQAAAYGAVIYSLHRRRFVHASVWSILAYFIRSSALIMGLALFVWFFVRIILTKLLSGGRIRESFNPRMFSALVVFPLFVILDKVHGEGYQLFWNKDRVFAMSSMFFPTLSLMLAVCALLMVYILIKRSVSEWFKQDEDRLHLVIFLIIFIYGFWVSFFLYPLPLCRYATGVILPMVCLLGLLFFLSFGQRSILIAVALIVFGSFNQYGALLPSLPIHVSRSGEHLERSREFLFDLAANKRVCEELEEHYFQDIIVAKRPFVRMLTIPAMGYVRKALPNIYAVGDPSVLTSAKRFDPELLKDPGTLYLYTPNVFEFYTRPRLLPSENDITVFADTTMGAPLIVYRRQVEAQTPKHRPTDKGSGVQPSLKRH